MKHPVVFPWQKSAPNGSAVVLGDLTQAAQLLREQAVSTAAAIGVSVLPPQLAGALTLRPAEDFATLKRLAAGANAVLTDCLHLEGASRVTAALRGAQARKRGEAAPSPIATLRNREPDIPTPQVKGAPHGQAPLLVLLADDLTALPALAALPGAWPDVVLLTENIARVEAEQVVSACLHAMICAVDSLADGNKAAGDVLSGAAELLASASPDGCRAAELLLYRGWDGRIAAMLSQALADRYGLPLTDCEAALLPAYARRLRLPLPDALPDTLASLGLPSRIDALRLMDVPELIRQARRLTGDRGQAQDDDLSAALRALYVPSEAAPSLDALCGKQQAFLDTGRTLDVAFRRRQLREIVRWTETHEADILAALRADLGKPDFEGYATEIMLVKKEAKLLARRLPLWQRDRVFLAPLTQFPAVGVTVRQPYGRTLILSPWNYPFLLSVEPLLGAIAGGNCAIVKPSAYAPHTSALLAAMAQALFDPEYVAVVTGGRAENTALLHQPFDKIFFTGSVAVGKTVMRAAAEHLTPVTLELGGKSPCIVDRTADVALAARRIAWGKFLNAGQTCVAPDYVLCHVDVYDQLIDALRQCVQSFYGENPLASPELARIVNEKHFQRLTGLLTDATVAFGGECDPEGLRIAPTVVRDVTWDAPLMQEEIFGPILPILPWDGDLPALNHQLAALPSPLAAYLFTADRAQQRFFLRRMRYGGGCVNDVVSHLATRLPFGGVGQSGMGAYHGRLTYESFVRPQPVLKKSARVDIPMRYPPYGDKMKWLKRL